MEDYISFHEHNSCAILKAGCLSAYGLYCVYNSSANQPDVYTYSKNLHASTRACTLSI